MTQEHSSKLSFSIEESVWLNKDQEVDEILSLSLDPDITVQEHGDYVLIRGGLKLTGEYRPKEKNEEYAGETLSQQVAFRSIEEIITHEDGTSEIKHTFPIDVTIPQERINSLDDIYVIVESFDYDLPERGCIQLTADVSITGMSASVHDNRHEEVNYEHDTREEEEERTFHFEATKQEEEEDFLPRDVIEEDELNDTEYEYNAADYDYGDYELEQQVEDASDDQRYGDLDLEEVEQEQCDTDTEDRSHQEQSPSIAFGVKHVTEQAEKKEVAQKSFSMLTNLTKNRPKQDFNIQLEEVEETKAAEVSAELEEESVETEQQEIKPREENALYLTKMLSKGDEQFSKLKMCIIQSNETLEVIANRYKINISTLIHVNKLNDEHVEEGQILYIPVKKA